MNLPESKISGKKSSGGLPRRLPTSSRWKQNPTKSVCLEDVVFSYLRFFCAAFFRDGWAFWRLALNSETRCKYCQGRPRWADGERFCFNTDLSGFPQKKEDLWDPVSPPLLFFAPQTLQPWLKASETAVFPGPKSGQIPSLWACGKVNK